ncbi:MAG: helix-turn-helix domain-containing protein [Clostridia bacterium]|nr:helix-turn-helix domain-containing protein [Clostridia bacterium]
MSNDFLPQKSADQVPEQTPQTNPDDIFSGLPTELLRQLTPAKTRMILLWLTGQYSQKKIAQVVNVSENTIRAWMLQPAVQAVITEIQNREFALMDSKIKAMRYKALDTMDTLLESDMDNVRFSAAKDILDRSGHKPQQKIQVDKTVTSIEQQLSQLNNFVESEAEIIDIDIDDLVAEVKSY